MDLICLAGYMRLLSPWFVQQFPRKILNIHPSLLPAFPGLEAQEQAFAYGVKVSGCTVHFVDEELDHGPIIVQKTVSVLDNDDEHTLAARILEQEHIAYSEAINIVLGGKFQIAGRRLKRESSGVNFLSPAENSCERRTRLYEQSEALLANPGMLRMPDSRGRLSPHFQIRTSAEMSGILFAILTMGNDSPFPSGTA